MHLRPGPVRLFCLTTVLGLAMATVAAAQIDIGTTPPPGTGSSPWSKPGWNEPKPRSERPENPFRFKVKRPRSIRCEIHQVEELGRIFVEDRSGDQYWIQLPSTVKISAADPRDFGGRRKLQVEDLEVGQRLNVTLRGVDDIRKVKVLSPHGASSKTRVAQTATPPRTSP